MTGGCLRRMRLFSVLAGTALVVALLGLGHADVAAGRASATITVCADPTQPAADFTTITAALTKALPNDTINVCRGEFFEQLTITKSVTLVGAGPGLTKVTAPQPPQSLTGTQDIVTISGSGVKVELSGFTIRGPGPTGAGLLDGVFVRDGAEANIHDNTITAMRNDPLDGAQKGYGIRVGQAAAPTSGTATISNNTISDYQKTGIIIDGDGSSATITGNTVTGAGPTPLIAQNGIQIRAEATASISGNTVSELTYTGDKNNASSTGILLYPNPGVVTVSKNTVSSTDNGIYVIGGPATNGRGITVSGNTVSGGDYGITVVSATGTLIENNKISDAANFGIDAEDDASGNTFRGNAASGTTGKGNFDCRDGSKGNKTADTANTWTNNTGATADPDGICSPKTPPTPEPEPPPPPEPGPAPPLDVQPPVVIVLPPIPNTPEASEEPPVVPVTPPGEQPAPPPPPEPIPQPPANPVQPLQPPGPLVEAKADEIITTMKKKELKSCAITLKAHGPQNTLVARGVAHAPGAAGRGVLVVRVGVVPAGQRLLAKQIGGATVDVRAACTTTTKKLEVKVKSARAVLRIEHTVTTPGSWVPDLPLLTPIGTRFVEQLAKRMVLVTKIRCDGYTAMWPPSPAEQYRLSFARATVVCGMLRRAGVKVAPKLVAHGHLDPIATNSTEPGRAANRRVAVTFVHKLASRTSGT